VKTFGILLSAALSVAALSAHNLDEYLQAALIEVSREHVEISVRMTPGPAVFDAFSGMIDRDNDGRISAEEQLRYRKQALQDWALSVDGVPIRLECNESKVAPMPELREGMGGIEIRCRADLSGVREGRHRLRFRNDHQPAWSAYMMNALQPGAGILIDAQRRDAQQREITIGYEAQGQAKQAGIWWLGAMLAPLLLRAGVLINRQSRKA
jgi:hypothetical protein